MPVTGTDLAAIAPLALLVAAACGLLVARPGRSGTAAAALAALAAAGVCAVLAGARPGLAFGGVYATSPLTAAFAVLAAASGAVSVLLLVADRDVRDRHAEMAALYLFVVSGALVITAGRHLVLTWLGFELLSIPAYVLVGQKAGDGRSAEGGLKYAVFGAAASASLLYGFSYLYGITGSLFHADIARLLAAAPAGTHSQPALVIALLFVFGGVMFKVSAAPFHYWCPDAFEAAPASAAGFLSVVPKIAGFGLLLAFAPLLGRASAWGDLLSTAAILSMILGNLAAIPQDHLRRLLAYSTIAHAGYLLVAAALGTPEGDLAVVYYLAAYAAMNLGAFSLASFAAPDCTLGNLRGLGARDPYLAFSWAVMLFSLTGLPPFGGFTGKVFIVAAALRSGHYAAVTTLVLASVVSLVVYARILKTICFESPQGAAPSRAGILTETLLGALAAWLLVLGILWEPFALWAQTVTSSAQG